MTSDAPTTDIIATARKLIAGEPCPMGEFFGQPDWLKAAQYALDSDDWSEFLSMLETEQAWERYGQYSDQFLTPGGLFPPVEFEDFRDGRREMAA